MPRPKSDDPKDDTIGFRVRTSTKNDLHQRAEKAGLSLSEYLIGCATGAVSPVTIGSKKRRKRAS